MKFCLSTLVHKVFCFAFGSGGCDLESRIWSNYCLLKVVSPAEKKCLEVKEARHKNKMCRIAEVNKLSQHHSECWPSKVPHDVIFKCLTRYHNATIWAEPQTCAACSQYEQDCQTVQIPNDLKVMHFLSILTFYKSQISLSLNHALFSVTLLNLSLTFLQLMV